MGPGQSGGGYTGFIKKDEWPPQSTECNQMDDGTWHSLKETVYRGMRDKLSEHNFFVMGGIISERNT